MKTGSDRNSRERNPPSECNSEALKKVKAENRIRQGDRGKAAGNNREWRDVGMAEHVGAVVVWRSSTGGPGVWLIIILRDLMRSDSGRQRLG